MAGPGASWSALLGVIAVAFICFVVFVRVGKTKISGQILADAILSGASGIFREGVLFGGSTLVEWTLAYVAGILLALLFLLLKFLSHSSDPSYGFVGAAVAIAGIVAGVIRMGGEDREMAASSGA